MGQSNDERVQARLTMTASAEAVFAVLTDPTSHPAIDGTGWVQGAVDRERLTAVGQVFRMDMYHPRHPDRNYRMANRVLVLDPPRAISWLPGQEDDRGTLDAGGWTWRYDLDPLGQAETAVTLTYDWSAVPPPVRAQVALPPFGPDHLTNSLHHLAGLATGRAGDGARPSSP